MVRALQAGAKGYLLKDSDSGDHSSCKPAARIAPFTLSGADLRLPSGTGMSMSIGRDQARVGQAYREYLQWSQQNWAGVVAQRAESLDRRAQAFGENITGQYWSHNPHTGNPERYSTTPAVTWVHRDGRRAESANSTFDPRTPTDNDWRRVER